MSIQNVKKVLLGLFMFGFLVGIIYANLFAKAYILSMGIFDDYFLSGYRGTDLNTGEYIFYIARIRMIPVFLLGIAMCTNFKKIAGGICLIWTGFSGGLILTSSVLKMGIKGILLCLIGIIPHYICYIAAYLMLLLYIFTYPDIRWSGTKSVSFLLFLLLGIISECYINPVLMDIFIKAL